MGLSIIHMYHIMYTGPIFVIATCVTLEDPLLTLLNICTYIYLTLHTYTNRCTSFKASKHLLCNNTFRLSNSLQSNNPWLFQELDSLQIVRDA